MMEFGEIAEQAIGHEFKALTKIVESMTEAEREAYAETNPVRVWVVAGVSEEHAIAFSAN